MDMVWDLYSAEYDHSLLAHRSSKLRGVGRSEYQGLCAFI